LQTPHTISSQLLAQPPVPAAGERINAHGHSRVRNQPHALISVCTLLLRHPCVHVKAAACESLLLLLQRFPLHCDVGSAAQLVITPALALVHSGNAHVLKAALQLLDHLMAHARCRTRVPSSDST
jgi:hypothetical protein